MTDQPSEFLPARVSRKIDYEGGYELRPVSLTRPLTAQQEQDALDVQGRLALRTKPLPPIPTYAQEHLDQLEPSDIVTQDDMGRTIVTRSIRHHGRPASVVVQLDEHGHAQQILSGTARLPGESETQYLRKMSSFAGWQLKDTKTTKGISWQGDQKHAYFSLVVMLVTFVILLVEIGTNGWVLEPFEVNPVLGPSKQVLLQLGAKQTSLIRQGDFYRLISAFWLHGGILHWLVNMIALWNLGFSLEREFGTPKIALLFLACGFMGVLTSAVFLPQIMGVGASGAIFGLFGCAWADLIQNWSLYVANKQAKRVLCQLVFGTVVNLVLGLAPALDQFAHIGGLITGLCLGFGITMTKRYTRFAEVKPFTRKQRGLQVCGALTVPAALVGLMVTLYGDSDVGAWCAPCAYINCVPIQGMWTCDYSGCSEDPSVKATTYLNNTVDITCPGGSKHVVLQVTSQFTSADLLLACQARC